MNPEQCQLLIRDLHAFYGKSHILHGVNLHIQQGEIVCLLGRNGVGRSTLAKAVMAQVVARGEVWFEGRQVLGLQSHQVARRGIGYVPENRDIFPDISTENNLLLGVQDPRATAQWSLADMYELFPRLEERRHTPGGSLSGGEQQMLTLCRSLMGNPRLVMIDEPTEGLAPKIVALVGQFLHKLKQRGVSVLLIEQKLDIALDVSDRAYVMGHGQIVFEGSPAQLKADAGLRKEWLEV